MDEVQRPPVRWSPPRLHPTWNFVLALGGFIIGVSVLMVGAFESPRSEEFVGSIGFLVWAAAIGAQPALWAVVAGSLWTDLVHQWRKSNASRPSIATIAVLIIAVLGAFPLMPLYADIEWPLWGHEVKLRSLTIAGALFVAVPALCGISAVHYDVFHRKVPSAENDRIRFVIDAHGRISRYLSAAGAVIGLAILAVGALREATVPEFVTAAAFPQEGVLVYGALFTGLLVLVYVPAHTSIRQLGAEIRDECFPLAELPNAASTEQFKSWLDNREALEGLLQLHSSPVQQVQASVAVLAPLLTALATYALPT